MIVKQPIIEISVLTSRFEGEGETAGSQGSSVRLRARTVQAQARTRTRRTRESPARDAIGYSGQQDGFAGEGGNIPGV